MAGLVGSGKATACLRDGMRPHRLDVADAASIGREILESTRERRRRRDLVEQLDLPAGPKASLIAILREAIDWDANRLAEQVPSAGVGSPICSCHLATGSWEVRMVEQSLITFLGDFREVA